MTEEQNPAGSDAAVIAEEIKPQVIDPVQKADDNLILEVGELRRRVARFAGGIKSGSRDDQLIRKYGERRVYPENFTVKDAQRVTPKIQKAAKEFRDLYDELLDRVNQAKERAGQKRQNTARSAAGVGKQR